MEKMGKGKLETSCMKRVNVAWSGCGGKVLRLAARGGKPLRLPLVEAPSYAVVVVARSSAFVGEGRGEAAA